jgi:hypothetical protein
MARGILDALMANPRGWGMTGMASPEEGVSAPQEPMSPGMAALKLIQRRAPGEAQAFVDQAPVNAALMAAGPVAGVAGRAAAANPALTAALLGGAGLMTSTTEAGSPQLTRKQARQMEMERMRIQAEADARHQEIEAEAAAANSRGENAAKVEAEKAQKAAELAEYERQVRLAEHARDTELSRARRFSDTTVGKTMDAMGGLAPVAAGMAVGAVSRGATGPGGLVKNYLLPGGLGAAGGITAANVPLAYDSLYTDPDNPEKAGYGAYSRELPPTHPRKKEFGDYAASLPAKNPVREQASEEFYDPYKITERALMGGVEGVGGGLVGADAVRLLGRAADSSVGRALMGKSTPTPVPHWTRQQRIRGKFGPLKRK